MSPLLAFAVDTAVRAGRLSLALFQSGTGFERKADSSPVTVADREVENFIRNAIREKCPDHAILGEEQGSEGDSSHRWVIDPIDGTKSFVAGVPLYSTLLALEIDGNQQMGVAYFPALGELVYAERGGGAFWNGRRARVSGVVRLEDAVICCGGHKSMAAKGRDRGLQMLAAKALATRTWGDAYGHCLVATGRTEAMIDPVVQHYDIAAIRVIIEEAGGSFTDFKGNDGVFQEAISVCPGLKEHVIGAFSE